MEYSLFVFVQILETKGVIFIINLEDVVPS